MLRYRWIDGGVVEREMERETATKYYYRKGSVLLACSRSAWHSTRAEALLARVEYCDAQIEIHKRALVKWQELAKEAYVLRIKAIAGIEEFDYDDGTGTSDGGGASGGGSEGETAQGEEGDIRTGVDPAAGRDCGVTYSVTYPGRIVRRRAQTTDAEPKDGPAESAAHPNEREDGEAEAQAEWHGCGAPRKQEGTRGHGEEE